MIHPVNQILCITGNQIYKDQLRAIISSHQTFIPLFVSNISNAITKLHTERFTLVIVDSVLSTKNSCSFDQLLKSLISLYVNQYTLIMVSQLSNDCFYKYIKLGFTYITDVKVIQYLLPAILEHMEEFKFQRPPPKAIAFKSLTILPASNTLLLKECKIKVNPQGILILLLIIKNHEYTSTDQIQRYLESVQGHKISPSYISVNMHRLSRQITKATGLKIIRNRYGLGYYLVL